MECALQFVELISVNFSEFPETKPEPRNPKREEEANPAIRAFERTVRMHSSANLTLRTIQEKLTYCGSGAMPEVLRFRDGKIEEDFYSSKNEEALRRFDEHAASLKTENSLHHGDRKITHDAEIASRIQSTLTGCSDRTVTHDLEGILNAEELCRVADQTSNVCLPREIPFELVYLHGTAW